MLYFISSEVFVLYLPSVETQYALEDRVGQWCSGGYMQVYTVYPLIFQWELRVLTSYPHAAYQSSLVEVYTVSIGKADRTDHNV